MSSGHETHRKVIDRLRSQAEEVRRLCADLDEETISRRSIPEKWSVKEVLAHVGRVQEVFERRLGAILEKEGAAISSYEPEEDPEFPEIAKKPAAELLRWFEGTRTRILDRLARLSPADWHRKGSHPEYPVYDVHFAMEYMAHHEAHHMYQMFLRRPSASGAPH